MGWFWTAKSADGAASPSPQTSSSSSQSDAVPATQPPPTSTLQDTPQSQPPVNDGRPENDPELRKFMAMFESGEIGLEDPRKAANNAPSKSSEPSKFAAWKAAWTSSAKGDASPTAAEGEEPFEPRERSLGEAVLPVSMSCRQAFDMAWACQSPAGQWRAVYRHGGVRQCSDLWDDFWFCMRVKGYAEGSMKEEAVRSYYRKKEIDRYYLPGKPSSEDVWRSRTVDEVIPPGAVFQNDFKVVVGGDGQQKQNEARADDNGREDASKIMADAERRQHIREQMGYTK